MKHVVLERLPRYTVAAWNAQRKRGEISSLSELLEFIDTRASGHVGINGRAPAPVAEEATSSKTEGHNDRNNDRSRPASLGVTFFKC